MASNCKDLDNTDNQYGVDDLYKQRAAELGFDEKYSSGLKDKPWWKRFLQSASDKYFVKNSPITQKELNKMLKKFTKDPSQVKKNVYVVNIMSLMQSNGQLREQFWKMISFESALAIPSEILGKKPFEIEQKKIVDPVTGKTTIMKVPVLSTLPLPVLDKLYREMYGWATAGRELKIADGFVGNMQLELLTPRTMEKKESTGAIRIARAATERYNENWQTRSLRYSSDTKDRLGFDSYNQKISDLHMHGKTQTTKKAMHFLHQFYPEGRIIFEEGTGKVFYYRDRKVVGENEDGTYIWNWDEESLVPFMNPLRGSEKEQLILDPKSPFPGEPSAMEIFMDTYENTQKLYREFGESTIREVELQNTGYSNLADLVKGDKKRYGNIPQKYIDELSPHFHEEVNIQGFNDIKLKAKGTYSPVYFSTKHQLPTMYDQAKEDVIDKIESLKITLSGADLSNEERQTLGVKLWHLENSLTYIEESRDRFDELSVDDNGREILTRQYIKNFKPISNMFDTRQRLIGPEITNDYLDDVAKVLERNAVTLEVLKALSLAKDDTVRDYVMELYKTTFSYPDTKSTFLTMDISIPRVKGLLQNIGIHTSEEWIRRLAKATGTYQIANLLNGPTTGLRNKTAVFNKIHDVSLDKVIEAQQLLSGREGNAWKDRAEKAGIVNFTRYLEGYVSRDLRIEERNKAKKHIDLLLKLVDDARDNPAKGKAYLKRYQKRLKLARYDLHIESKLNAYAQWAITHNLRDIDMNEKWAYPKKFGRTILGLDLYKSIPAIQDTEGYVRTISYIIGSTLAIEKGLATHPDDPMANLYGIEYTFLSDHGLHQQNLGYAFRGGLGNLNTKLKMWSTQRMGREWRIIRDAYRSMGDYTLDDNGKPIDNKGYEKLLRLTKTLLVPGTPRRSKAMREANPYASVMRSFLLKQGLATLLIDYVIMAPGGSAFSKVAKRAFHGGGTTVKAGTGLSSDLLSLTFLMSTILWKVATGNADEDDLDDRTIMKFIRHSWLGVLPATIVEAILAATRDYEKQSEEYRNDWDGKHGPNAIVPYIPGGRIGKGIIDTGVYGYEQIYQK